MSTLITLKVYYEGEIIICLLLSNIIWAVYMYSIQYVKWWTSLIPFGVYYSRYEVGASTWIVGVPAVLCAVGVYIGIIPMAIIWYICYVVSVYNFAKNVIDDCNTLVFTFVPLYKYYYMIREVVKLWTN